MPTQNRCLGILAVLLTIGYMACYPSLGRYSSLVKVRGGEL